MPRLCIRRVLKGRWMRSNLLKQPTNYRAQSLTDWSESKKGNGDGGLARPPNSPMAINPHTPRVKDEAITLADWLEFEALTSDNGVGSLLELARQLGIAGVGDAEDEGRQEPRQFTDHPKLDDVMNELESRSAGCGDGYPFDIDGGGTSITRKADWG